MSITLDLSPDAEARLMAEAASRGISVQELLKTTIDAFLAASEPPPAAVTTPEDKASRFIEWVRSHSIQTPPLSDEAISRESIYREREDSQL